jgi:hypothetical protein
VKKNLEYLVRNVLWDETWARVWDRPRPGTKQIWDDVGMPITAQVWEQVGRPIQGIIQEGDL